MHYAFNIHDWCALAPGLETKEDWKTWSHQSDNNWQLPLSKCAKIPMMIARRMSTPSRLAVEVGLSLLDAAPDCAIFISRHGEIERSYKILDSLNKNTDISPTDFAMSVHNAAAGLLTITAQSTLPLTSIAAGRDGFTQGLIEAQIMFHAGAKRILLIDFDGLLPKIYHSQISTHHLAYAAGFILTPGTDFVGHAIPQCSQISPAYAIDADNKKIQLPQGLAFLKAFLKQTQSFTLAGIRQNWHWNRTTL